MTLLDVVKLKHPAVPAIVCDDISSTNMREFCLCLSYDEILYYPFSLLETLHFYHSHGIMHRGVKPNDIVVNMKQKRMQLIDFGLSDYYLPGKAYQVNVGTRYYKEPELLVGYKYSKPTRTVRIKREESILESLREDMNIMTLLDIVKLKHPAVPAIVCDDISSTNMREFYFCLSYEEILYYPFSLLETLHFYHSHGIMHRNVKPSNIVVNMKQKRVHSKTMLLE
uniref:non-specific serine/threonine protein kinase n=1 Tax=Trichuris muris TaxID=70415 RepID=A0A5S6Q6Z3_TRIMR